MIYMREKDKLKQIILILFSILPFIDSLNGIFIKNDMFSIGSLYKVFLIVYLIFLLAKKGDILKIISGSKYVLFFIVYIFLSVLINLFLLQSHLISYSYPFKLIFNVIFMYILYSCLKNQIINRELLDRIFSNNVIFIIICIFIPYIFGLGNTIYSGNIGYKGFYFSQNELSAILIILLFYSLYKLCNDYSIISFLKFLGVLFCIVIMSSKTSMLVALIAIIVLCINFIFTKKNYILNTIHKFKNINFKRKFLIILIILFIFVICFYFLSRPIFGFLSRQTSLITNYKGSILATITSGRIYYVNDAIKQLINSPYYILNILIGNGFISNFLVEMDFFDIFFYTGLIGVLILVWFIQWIFKKSTYMFLKDKSFSLIIGFILLLCFSFVAGHILFMSTSGIYACLYCAFLLSNEYFKEENKNG